jgi:cell division protein ZapA (FtsZ GTPase activity inhibitor)
MEPDQELININVNICDRPYRLKVKPSEEENVRRAAKMINDKVKDLQSQYSAKDKQDYLAMSALTYMVEKISSKADFVIKDTALMDRISDLDSRLNQVLSP